MKRFDTRIIFGLALVFAGSMFLLENLGFFEGGINILWAILVGSAGVASLYAFAINRENWWALIPGGTLLAVGLNILLSAVAPNFGDMIGGSIILGGIGLSFWLVFLNRRAFWWAVIPAGILSSLAIVSLMDELFPYGDTDGFFLIGFGMTFLLLAFLPDYGNTLRWALIPGGILTLIGIIKLPFMGALFTVIWPLALIAAGGYVLYKNYK